MSQYVNVRTVQAALACSYFLVAAVAVARAQSLVETGIAVAMLFGAYLTGRVVPDVWIDRKDVLPACRIGLLLTFAGLVVDVAGGRSALGWSIVVMAYCAGNRLKAAGIGAAT